MSDQQRSEISGQYPNSFVMPLVMDPSKMTADEYALYLAVLHHGLAAMSSAGVPSSTRTVMRTATEFGAYLKATEKEPARIRKV